MSMTRASRSWTLSLWGSSIVEVPPVPMDGGMHSPQPQAAFDEFRMDVDDQGFPESDLVTLGLLNSMPQADSDFHEEEDIFQWGSWN